MVPMATAVVVTLATLSVREGQLAAKVQEQRERMAREVEAKDAALQKKLAEGGP